MKWSARNFPATLAVAAALLMVTTIDLSADAGPTETSPDSPTGTFSWKLGAWTFGVPTVSDTAFLFIGTIEVDGAVATGRLRLGGGTLTGATDSSTDSLTLHGTGTDSRWTSGTIAQLSLIVGTGAGLDLENSGNNTFSAALLDVRGHVDWLGGNIYLGSSSGITVAGTFNDSLSGARQINGDGTGAIAIQSGGSYVKNATGTTSLNRTFNNDGTVDVDAGTLVFNGGGTNSAGATIDVASGAVVRFNSDYTISDAAQLLGAGAFEITSGTLSLTGTVNVDNFFIRGGTLSGTHTFTNGATWTAGNLNAADTTTNASGSVFNISSSSVNDFNARTIVNQSGGTINWTDGDLRSGNGSVINNAGTFNDSAAPTGIIEYVNSVYGGTAAVFNNQSTGIYNKTSAGQTQFDVNFNNDGIVNVENGTLILNGGGTNSSTGTFAVDAGATLQFDSDYTVTDAADLTGAGTIRLTANTLTLAGDIGISNFLIQGGTLAGTYTFTNGATWSGGNLNASGTTTNANGSVFNFSNSGQNDFNARTIVNQSGGTINWTDGDLRSGNGGVINNAGIFNDSAAPTGIIEYMWSAYGGTAPVFNNQSGGTYNKTSTGQTEFDIAFNNAGTVNVEAGILKLDGGGTNSAGATVEVDSGATLNFGGSYTIADAADLIGDGQFTVTNGTLTLTGELGASNFNLNGVSAAIAGTHTFANGFIWSDGNFNTSGTTTNADGSTFAISDSGGNQFRYRTFVNDGTTHWTAGSLLGGTGSSFTNNGIFNDTANARSYNAWSGNHSFTNTATGIYNKNGTGTTDFDHPFNNEGTVNVNTGTLLLGGTGTNSTGATIEVDSGATLQFGNDYTIEDAADLIGEGQFTVTLGTLALDGEVGVWDFLLDGAFAIIAGTQTFTNDVTWRNGSFNSSGTTINADESTFNIADHGGNQFRYRTFINDGTVNWTAGNLLGGTGSSFTNNGIFNDTADMRYYNAWGGGLSFTNSPTGTYNKSGTGISDIEGTFTNQGTVNVNAGTLLFSSGTATFGSTSIVTIANGASLEIEANTAITAGAEFSGGGTFVVDSGTLTGEADFETDFLQDGGTLDGEFNFLNQWEFASGTIAAGRNINLKSEASGVINAVSFLDLNHAELFVEEGADLAWESGTIRLGGGATVSVEGVMTTNFDGETNQDLAGSGSVEVSGSFRKTAGTGTTSFDLPVDVTGHLEVHRGTLEIGRGGAATGGTFDIWNGATLNFQNGYTFNDETSVTNGGDLNLNAGTFNVTGDVDFGPHAAFNGGTMTGTHSLSGRIKVDGGYFDANGITTLASGAALEFSNGESNQFDRSFVNHGKILWSEGDFSGSGNNTLTNNGEFAIEGNGTFSSEEDDFSIINNGDFVKQDGDGTTTIDVPFTNHGLVAAESGHFHFTDSITFGDNATLGGGLQFDVPLNLGSSTTLGGNGNIMGDITTNGTVSPGNSIGNLSITGDLTLLASSSSFFEVDVSGDPDVDYISVSGTLTLGGNLSWDLLSSLDPVSTDTFTLYTANNLTGSFLNVANGGRLFTSDNQNSFVVNYGVGSVFDPNSVVFSNFEFTPIPEPSTWALMVVGLWMVVWRGSRRRARR